MAAHTDLGNFGEQWIAAILGDIAPVEPGARADLRFLGLELEIKTARPRPYRSGNDLGYQFCLTRDGHTDHTKADIVILLCLTPDLTIYPYIIPAGQIGDRRKIVIPTPDPETYTGQWSPWLAKWEILANPNQKGA